MNEIKKAGQPSYELEDILDQISECNEMFEAMFKKLKKPQKKGTNIVTTLLTYMPAAFKILYEIHDFIKFNGQKIMKDELFSKYLPEDFRKNFLKKSTKAVFENKNSIK